MSLRTWLFGPEPIILCNRCYVRIGTASPRATLKFSSGLEAHFCTVCEQQALMPAYIPLNGAQVPSTD